MTVPAFIDADQAIMPQTLLLTSLYAGIAIGVHLLLVLLAAQANKIFGLFRKICG